MSDGQFVETINAAGTELLYANVAEPANATTSVLPVTFETVCLPLPISYQKLLSYFAQTPNTFGTFVFQGDAVTWSVASIDRPNTAAWYVCENQQLFINLGAYDYLTPAGCSDETVSFEFSVFLFLRDAN